MATDTTTEEETTAAGVPAVQETTAAAELKDPAAAYGSYESSEEKAKAESGLLADAEKAADAVWNDGTLVPGTGHPQIAAAEETVAKAPEGAEKDALMQDAENAEAALEEMENRAYACMQAVWDFPGCTLADGATRDKYQEAKDAVEALPDLDVKNALLPAISSSDILLSEREVKAAKDAANDTVPALTEGLGDYGRLIIPDVGIDVGLNEVTCDEASDQAIVDRKDSAIHVPQEYYPLGEEECIADHTDQGFCRIRDVEAGYTKAYVFHTDGSVSTYVCIELMEGHNNISSFTDYAGNDLSGRHTGGIMMYTCHGCWQNISIAYWQPC